MNRPELETQVLSTLRGQGGPVRPAELVRLVMEDARVQRKDVREALRGLVDRQEVALTWHGELESSHG